MNIMDFTLKFKKMGNFFQVSKLEEKCDAYYEYFENKKLKPFSEAVEHIIKKKDRFPTVALLLEVYQLYDVPEEFKGCHICDGSGWVYDKQGNVRRGSCEHGLKISVAAGKPYDGVSEYKQNVKRTIEQESYLWASQMLSDPERFMKGFAFIENILKRHNPELHERVNKLIDECLGVQMAMTMRKKYPSHNKTRKGDTSSFEHIGKSLNNFFTKK